MIKIVSSNHFFLFALGMLLFVAELCGSLMQSSVVVAKGISF